MRSIPFRIGAATYALIRSDKPIFGEEGEPLEGCAIEGLRMLVISSTVEPDRVEEIARHECFHAWRFHVPAPANEEEEAQLHATVAAAFQQDLEAAGGVAALRDLRPTKINLGNALIPSHRVPVTYTDFGRTDRMPCGGCGDTEIMCGSIHTGSPVLHRPTRRFHVERWMKCDGCGVVQVWHEVSSADGVPLGEYCSVPSPRLLRGEDAAAWMAERELVMA